MRRKLSPYVKPFSEKCTSWRDAIAGSILAGQSPSARAVRLANRRYRLLGIWIAALLVLSAGTSRHLAAQETSETRVSSATLAHASGPQTFRTQCAACHGLDARGGEHAPSIVQNQLKSMSDKDLAGIIRNGVPEKGMPAFSSLGSGALKELIAYPRRLQPSSVGKAEIVSGDAARGRRLFFGKAGCSDCHVMRGTGNLVADDLSDCGRHHQPSEIRAAILKPEKPDDSPSEQAIVTTQNGTKFSGVVRNEDSFSLQLQDTGGEFYLIEKFDVVRISRAPLPGMPEDYAKRLGPQEVDDLVSYIAQPTAN